MTDKKEQMRRLLLAARPLMAFIKENCHPHMKAVVDQEKVELVETVVGNVTEESVKHDNCCFCGIKIGTRNSHNAWPLDSIGRCCNDCNASKVIPARITLADKVEKEKELIRDFNG